MVLFLVVYLKKKKAKNEQNLLASSLDNCPNTTYIHHSDKFTHFITMLLFLFN